jgi:protein-tyrosine kinase
MTRLADALQRANRGRDGAAVSLTPVPSTGDTAAPPHGGKQVRKVDSSVPAVSALPTPRAIEARNPRSGDALTTRTGGALIVCPSGPHHSSAWRRDPELVGKLVGTDGFSAGALEQYRKLAATLHHAQEDRGTQVVMTASSLPGEGKSLTVVNVALTLSESYEKNVLLIDADLRRPTVQRIFDLPTINGLDDGLKGHNKGPLTIVSITDRLSVLPAGRPDPDPLSGLASDRMRRLIAQARDMFDWVLIDTPPVTLLPDANLLTACVDGALLIVRSGKAPYQLVKRAVETLGHDRILGVVMNAVDFAHDRNAGGYYEYYGHGYYGAAKKK